MYQYFAENIKMPPWATIDGRYWTLFMHDLWLKGKFYRQISSHGFWCETGDGGRLNKMYEKMPSVQLNLPILCADMTSRMLFAPARAPRVSHEDSKPLEKSMKWLLKKGKLLKGMLDAGFWAQGGSCAVTLKVVDGQPCMNVWPGRHCWPTFNDAEKLERLQLAYTVSGAQFLSMQPPIGMDYEGNAVDADKTYWYVRLFDNVNITTCLPIPYEDWNPESGDPGRLKTTDALVKAHKAPAFQWSGSQTCQAVMSQTGRATFKTILDNAIHLDFLMSQMGRGLNSSASPMLMTKGRVLNADAGRGGSFMVGPQTMLQLAPDRKNGDAQVTGSTAEWLEIKGSGIQVGVESWADKMKSWTMQIASMARKDPDTISGAMSGKAMELIDSDFINLVEILKLCLGDEGLLEIIKLWAEMLALMEHPKFKGFNADLIDECELDWPKLFPCTPDEVNMLLTALANAIKGGVLDQEESRIYLASMLNLRGQGFDPHKIPDLAKVAEDTGQKPSEDEQQANIDATKAKAQATLNPPAKPAPAGGSKKK